MAKIKRLFRILAALAVLPGLIAAAPSTGRVFTSSHVHDVPALNGAAPLSPLAAGDEMWSGQFALGANNKIDSIAAASNGDIYVAGDFTQIAGINANHVARWNAFTGRWSSLGSGINSSVDALALSGGYLYAAGSFSSAGGLTANSVARWNLTTNTWSVLGTGLVHANTPASGRALAADGTGGVYVGGQFDSAGGVFCQTLDGISQKMGSLLGQMPEPHYS